jgi:hypothetical protein
LIIQRTLEFGDWEDVRWLFRRYGKRRISAYVRRYGQRGLSRVTFNYWRRLLGIYLVFFRIRMEDLEYAEVARIINKIDNRFVTCLPLNTSR